MYNKFFDHNWLSMHLWLRSFGVIRIRITPKERSLFVIYLSAQPICDLLVNYTRFNGFLLNGCGRTYRVNRVYFLETWLKTLNNLTWLKVVYNKITGFYFMSGRTELGYEKS